MTLAVLLAMGLGSHQTRTVVITHGFLHRNILQGNIIQIAQRLAMVAAAAAVVRSFEIVRRCVIFLPPHMADASTSRVDIFRFDLGATSSINHHGHQSQKLRHFPSTS
jgi:hypothetical protein